LQPYDSKLSDSYLFTRILLNVNAFIVRKPCLQYVRLLFSTILVFC
jgi:hypothetical protein